MTTDAPGAVVRFAAEVVVTPDEVRVRAQIRNEGTAAIFVFNESWRNDMATSTVVPDASRPYRFLERASLRLLTGVAPPPPGKNLYMHFTPYATRIPTGGALDLRYALAQRVKEYNPYYGEKPSTRYTDVDADHVELIVQYLTETADVSAQPAQWAWASSFFNVKPISPIGGAYPGERLRASAQVTPFRAARRVGDFARVVL